MGEYVKYRGEEIKIGTMYNLYYATYPKYVMALQFGQLSKANHNDNPQAYAEPDAGFGFRFPFPDEDHLPLGSIKGGHDRGITIKLDNAAFQDFHDKDAQDSTFTMEIVQQTLMHRQSDNQLCLALVLRHPKTGQYFGIAEDANVKKILTQIIKHYIQDEGNMETKMFYRTVAARILKGYKVNSAIALQRRNKDPPREIRDNNLFVKRKR